MDVTVEAMEKAETPKIEIAMKLSNSLQVVFLLTVKGVN